MSTFRLLVSSALASIIAGIPLQISGMEKPDNVSGGIKNARAFFKNLDAASSNQPSQPGTRGREKSFSNQPGKEEPSKPSAAQPKVEEPGKLPPKQPKMEAPQKPSDLAQEPEIGIEKPNSGQGKGKEPSVKEKAAQRDQKKSAAKQPEVEASNQLFVQQPEKSNATVHNILKQEVPITPSVQKLARSITQQGRKLFLSYCWSNEDSTVPMVDDFENFIHRLEIANYYRDKRGEEGFGMTLGIHIESFMKNARDADVTVIFLNDAYLRSRNCMYEFLQVWDANTQAISPNAFIIRYPDFRALFRGVDAAFPYIEHWKEEYKKLDGKKVAAADRKGVLEEMVFVTDVEKSVASIVQYIAKHIQANYQEQRSKGFEDVFKVALREKGHNPAAAGVDIPLGMSSAEDAEQSYNLAQKYHHGLGVPQDYEKAMKEYEKAAAQGNHWAQTNLGDIYRDGLGVPQNYDQAREWYQKAALQGNDFAQTSLGFLYHNGQGVPQNYVRAREWYERAAAQGNASAQYNLGVLYHNGLRVAKDYEKARKWYEKAAAQGNANAKKELDKIQQETAEARRAEEEARRVGEVEQHYNLAIKYYNGQGLPQDYVQ
ncbi:MAG: hypothetical protein K0R24_2293, partial [Gammaproteobacteria bacterium]|nr:hypothetical protein [Gammaproteobacteria bacterium]